MPLDPEYVRRFKADVVTMPAQEIFERYIAADVCAGFPELDEGALRQRIGHHFGLKAAEVMIVGSAKIGFSLMPNRKRPAFTPFSEDSDVDVAIVSDTLFDRIWKECLQFWHGSGYSDASGYWSSRGKDFRAYHFRGWMRPDKLPSEGGYNYANEWFDFFRTLIVERAAGDYRITGGVYRERYFLQMYQQIAIEDCRARVAL